MKEITFLDNGNIAVFGVSIGDFLFPSVDKLKRMGFNANLNEQNTSIFIKNVKLFGIDSFNMFYTKNPFNNRIGEIKLMYGCENYSMLNSVRKSVLDALKQNSKNINAVALDNTRIINEERHIDDYYANEILEISIYSVYGSYNMMHKYFDPNRCYLSVVISASVLSKVGRVDYNNEKIGYIIDKYFKLLNDSYIKRRNKVYSKFLANKVRNIPLIKLIIICITILAAIFLYAYSNRYEIYHSYRIDKWANKAEPLNIRHHY